MQWISFNSSLLLFFLTRKMICLIASIVTNLKEKKIPYLIEDTDEAAGLIRNKIAVDS